MIDHAAANGKTTDSKHNVTIYHSCRLYSPCHLLHHNLQERWQRRKRCASFLELHHVARAKGQINGDQVHSADKREEVRHSLTAEGSKCSLGQAEHGHSAPRTGSNVDGTVRCKHGRQYRKLDTTISTVFKPARLDAPLTVASGEETNRKRNQLCSSSNTVDR